MSGVLWSLSVLFWSVCSPGKEFSVHFLGSVIEGPGEMVCTVQNVISTVNNTHTNITHSRTDLKYPHNTIYHYQSGVRTGEIRETSCSYYKWLRNCKPQSISSDRISKLTPPTPQYLQGRKLFSYNPIKMRNLNSAKLEQDNRLFCHLMDYSNWIKNHCIVQFSIFRLVVETHVGRLHI